MVSDWLRDVPCTAVIVDGKRNICGVRLFGEGVEKGNGYLYVGRKEGVISAKTPGEILLVHGRDVICVASGELNDIFNWVLAAFEFYAELEVEMISAVFKPHPEQRVLSVCEHLLGPMFIMEPDYHILACSQNYSHSYVNVFWESFVNNKEPSVDMIFKMKSSTVTGLARSRQRMKLFREESAKPYDYGIINSYTDARGKIIGSFILASDKEITPYEMDMAGIIMEALERIQFLTTPVLSGNEPEATEEILLSRLVSGTDRQRTVQYIKALYSLEDTVSYYLVLVRTPELFLLPALREEISKRFLDGISACLEDEIVLLAWGYAGSVEAQIDRCRTRLSERLPVKFGVSNVFDGLWNCKYYREQARLALQEGVTRFGEIAPRMLVNARDPMFRWFARHPGISVLEAFDFANHTELVKTLKVYLFCERSIKRAAGQLYIHRNTVLYRMDQIKEKGLFNLDDDSERQYLLLSLLVDRPRGEDSSAF